MSEAVTRHYEGYPYPARDPKDEAKRLITGSPSHLDELDHHLFAGRLRLRRADAGPFRVLVAGGGTGDGLIMLAQQCRDAGLAVAIDYLDLSRASRALAEARAQARGLTDLIAFHTGSLLDPGRLPGPYDYIDCCGVLHHLDDPAAGLAALVARLAPGGGLGLMVYGRYGRSGVYELQSALRRLTGDLPRDAGGDTERLARARKLLDGLPPTNRFRHNPLLRDHLVSPAGLYDLLLHSQDRAYTVPELADWIAGAGLAIASLIDPLRYDPALYLDPRLRPKLAGLSWLERAALAEELAGNLKTHIVYAARAGEVADRAAVPGPAMVPVLRDLDGRDIARGLRPGQGLIAGWDGFETTLPLPRLAAALLARIDGSASLDDLYRDLAASQGGRLTREAFDQQFAQLFAALNGTGKLFLRAAG